MPNASIRGFALLAVAAVVTGCAHQPTPAELNLQHCVNTSKAMRAEQNQQVIQESELCLTKNTLPPKIKSTVYLLQSVAYTNLKQYPQAISAREKFIATNPHPEPRATLELSYLYRLNGNPQKALELVQSNLDAGLGENGKGAGFNMPTFYHLGLALYDLGQYREAAEAYSAGLIKQPDYAWAYYQRALAYDRLGDKENARRDLTQFAKRVDPSTVEAQHKAQLAAYQIKLP
jgi:tetratricopeptide (TPR) repeat protein